MKYMYIPAYIRIIWVLNIIDVYRTVSKPNKTLLA